MTRGRTRGLACAAVFALSTPVLLLPAATGTAAVAPEKKKPGPVASDTAPRPGQPLVAPVELRLAEFTPSAPRGADVLTLRGSLVNSGPEALAGVSVRLRVSTRTLANRSEIASVAAGQPGVRETTPVPGGGRPVAPTVAPGAVVPWAVEVPVKSLKLPGNGVYAIQVEALSADGPVAALTTFLPFLPKKKQYGPTRVSWLWPLAAEPSRDAHGVFVDDSLAEQLVPGGRLAELAEAPAGLPVTWMVDPELLESVAALAQRHSVRDGKKVTTEAGDPNAARWLEAVRHRLAGKPVAALPYADPDVAGLIRHDAGDRVVAALARARSTTANLLGRTSDTALAWPPDGLADERTLGALREAGATAVVLSSAVVTPTAALPYTPTGRATVLIGEQEPAAAGLAPKPERMQALLADAGLAGALSGDLSTPGAAQLAAQRFLADTAMLTLERPNEQRTVLVTPPRRWAPPAGWAAGLLATSGAVPWLETVGLATMSRTVEAPALSGATLAYPPDARPHELGRPFVARLEAAATSAEDVAAVLEKPGALSLAYQAAVMRSASSVWRDERQRGRDYLGGVEEALRADARKVKVLGRSLVTLSSNHGTVPITVENGLSQAVRVRLVLTPKVGSRLRVATPAPVTINPGRKQTVRVEARASTNGITRVEVMLESASGRPFGTPLELRVNTTSYGSVGLIVVGGAAVVLFLAAGTRNVRRIRAARSGGGPVEEAPDRPPGLPVDETVQA